MLSRASLAAAVAIATLALPACGQDEATYEGKPASYWVDRLVAGHPEAKEPVLAIGAPCVPLLLRRMPQEDVPGAWLALRALEELSHTAAPAFFAELKSGDASSRLLALSCLLELPEPPEGLRALLPQLLKDGDTEFRLGAALYICEHDLYLDEAVPALLAALRHDEAYVRWQAASFLAHFHSHADRVVPALVAATKDSDLGVVAIAIESLGHFWDMPLARRSILLAYDSNDPARQAAALRALVEVPDPAAHAVQRCLDRCADDNEDVRKAAHRALRHIWFGRRVPLGSHRTALTHSSPEIRELACRGAGRSDRRAHDDVIERLEDRVPEVRLAAVGALRHIGDASAAVGDALVARLRDPETAHAAASTLIHLRTRVDDAALHFVARMRGRPVHADGQPHRSDLIERIAGLGPIAKAAVPALRDERDHSDPTVATEAAWALYVITGDPNEALPLLFRTLEQGDWYAKVRAAIIVSRFGPVAKDAVPILHRLLDDEWYGVRRYAATALGYIGPAARPAIPKLKELLDDHESKELGPVYHVCRHAAAALAYLDVDTPKVKDLLGKVIEESDANDGSTRPGALRYAWKHGGMPVDEVVDRLQRSLGPPNWDDVPPIVDLLGEMGPSAKAAIPALEKLLRRRYELRHAAEQALNRIRP